MVEDDVATWTRRLRGAVLGYSSMPGPAPMGSKMALALALAVGAAAWRLGLPGWIAAGLGFAA